MNLLSAFSINGAAETFLRKRGFWILLVFALGYYGFYYNVWPGPYGEGGLVAVLAQRLMEGQRPIVDTFLGYNVLWFYPVVAVFKLTGPSYIALRLFFFGLSLVTGLIGWRLMMALTGRGWAAFLAGLLMIGLPGQMYRNYMAFLAVMNVAVFIAAFVLPHRNAPIRLVWMFAAGLSLGIAYLIRVDIGFLLSFLLAGLAVVFPFTGAEAGPWRKRILLSVAGLILIAAGVTLTHLPVWRDACNRGFSKEFAAQYSQWTGMIVFNAERMSKSVVDESARFLKGFVARPPALQQAGPSPTNTPAAGITAAPAATPQPQPTPAKLTSASLERPSWKEATTFRKKIFFLNLNLPVPASVLLFLLGAWAWLSGLFLHDAGRTRLGMAQLVSLGGALVLFPQYYWWRPDMVHLSEFMVPMILSLVLSFVIVGKLFRGGRLAGRIFCAASLATGAFTLGLYANNGFQSGSSGGIAVSQHKTVMFHALNGVDVRMMPVEKELNTALFTIVTSASDRGEPVICYPYNPEINFMADRPSYEWNLYADNDLPADQFCDREWSLVTKHSPPVIVINNWDINGTEESRFRNWAAPLCRKIASGYTPVYRGENFEVYVRPDRLNRIPERYRPSAITPAP